MGLWLYSNYIYFPSFIHSPVRYLQIITDVQKMRVTKIKRQKLDHQPSEIAQNEGKVMILK